MEGYGKRSIEQENRSRGRVRSRTATVAAIVFETFNSKKSPCLQFSNCEQGDFSIQERIWFVPSARPPITPVLLFVPRYFSFRVTSKDTTLTASGNNSGSSEDTFTPSP